MIDFLEQIAINPMHFSAVTRRRHRRVTGGLYSAGAPIGDPGTEMKTTQRSVLTTATCALLSATSIAGVAVAQDTSAQDTSTPDAKLETIVVEGYREGAAKALQQKRASPNLVDIVASDSIGNLPDRNVADALSRLSGVTLIADDGEGRFVSIRGINPNLNRVTVNGVAPASSGIRNLDGRDSVSGSVIPLDVIGSAQANQLEVVKSLTPDMDGSGIGGAVNIRTASAFDFAGPLLTGSLASGYSDYAEDSIYEGDVTWADRLGADRTTGVALSLSYSRRPFRTEGFQSAYRLIRPAADQLAPISFELLPEDAIRKRLGATANFESRPDADSSYYLRTVYSQFDEDNDRREARLVSTTRNGALVADRVVRLDGPIQATQDIYQTTTEQSQFTASGGFERTRGDFNVASELAYSHGEQARGQDGYRFQNTSYSAPTTIDFTDYEYRVTTDDALFGDPSSYSLGRYTIDDARSEETIITPKLDLTWQLEDLFGHPGSLKAGVKYNRRDREVTLQRDRYTGSFTAADTGAIVPGEDVRGRRTPFTYDWAQLNAYVQDHQSALVYQPADALSAYAAESFDVTEDIHSGYLMGTIEIGRLMLFGGVRYESTSAEVKGPELQTVDGVPSDTLAINRADMSFDNLLPNLQARFDVNPNLVLRAAVTQSISRPEYEYAAPKSTLVYDSSGGGTDPAYPFTGTLAIGNPDLDPYVSTNYDLSFEYYLDNGAAFSIAGFHKEIDNPIYLAVDVELDTVYNGIGFAELNRTSYRNAEKGRITGVEFAANIPFTFLPPPFDGFGVDANVTLTSSSVSAFSRPGEDLPFFEQPEEAANLVVYYQKNRFAARVAANYQGASLRQLNASSDPQKLLFDLDFYRASRLQVDAQASYLIGPRFTIFANVQNLTDEPQNTYAGESNILRYSRKFGWNVRAGARFRF